MTKKTTPMRIFTLSLFVLFLFISQAKATIFTSAQSGYFSVGTTWIGGNVPGPGDDIVIASGHTVTLDNSFIQVRNISIANGATLDNSTYPLTVYSTSPGANPVYLNNGIHTGTGNLVLYDGGMTTFSGNGTTNCNVEIVSYGLNISSTCSLVINGNLQHSVPGNNGMNGKVFISGMEIGGMLTVNGSVITDELYSVGVEIGNTTLTISGNLSLPGGLESGAGSTLTIYDGGTLDVDGNLVLGPYSGYCQNFGTVIIGGNLVGAFDTYFIQEMNSTAKFGGEVFADGSGYLFAVESPLLGSSIPNTIEYNGTVSQTITVPADMAYADLVVNNTSAIATMESDIPVMGNLTIKPGASFSLNEGVSLSVTGTFLIESNETGTGSFIGNSSLNGVVERYIAGHNGNASAGWHLLSSPVASQAISTFHTPGSGDDFYKWDEPTSEWINRTDVGGLLNPDFEVNFASGKGYLVANVTDATPQFEGLLNTADVTVSNLTNSAGMPYSGWHLIGNPFTSALTWNDGNWSLNNVDAACQIWNEANASYSVISPDGIIPAMNGVMVHAATDNASLTIPAMSRTHNSAAWYKSVDNAYDQITIIAYDYAGETAQPSIIRFDANATVGYDSQYDSYFLAGYAPLFYSKTDNANYALNSLPFSAVGNPIQLGFIKNEGSQFTIAMSENTANYNVYLKDSKTGQAHLLNQGTYTFDSEEGDDEMRFSLHFGTVGITDTPVETESKVWIANNILYTGNDITGKVAIYDMFGRMVKMIQRIPAEGMALDLPAGVYIVSTLTDSQAGSTKVIVK